MCSEIADGKLEAPDAERAQERLRHAIAHGLRVSKGPVAPVDAPFEVGDEHEVFVPALARDEIRFARGLDDAVGGLAQYLVADRTAETLVHAAESLQIDEHDGDAEVGSASSGEREVEVLLETRPGRQAGQRVVGHQAADVLLGLAQACGKVLLTRSPGGRVLARAPAYGRLLHPSGLHRSSLFR